MNENEVTYQNSSYTWATVICLVLDEFVSLEITKNNHLIIFGKSSSIKRWPYTTPMKLLELSIELGGEFCIA